MTLAIPPTWLYSLLAAANSADGIGVSVALADTPPQSGFFVSAAWQHLYGGGRVVASSDAPVPMPGTPTPHGSALPDWRQTSGKSSSIGDLSMTKRRILTLNPSKARARFHRACAIAALHSNSSLAVRLRRYNAAMKQARALETQEASHA